MSPLQGRRRSRAISKPHYGYNKVNEWNPTTSRCPASWRRVLCVVASWYCRLYGERVGALHVVCSGAHLLPGVESELLFRLIRSEHSTNPLFGARLVTIVLGDPELRQDWEAELGEMRARLKGLRSSLVSKFRELEVRLSVCLLLANLAVRRLTVLLTPGDRSFISREKGLFAVLPLSPDICRELAQKHHIYIVPNGRINISGLKAQAIARLCELVDAAVRRLMTSAVNSANEVAPRQTRFMYIHSNIQFITPMSKVYIATKV
ncbi:hypothetical protein CDEST_07590 [Colletotrichum destructivum]|uniref:Aminotransferase class I/classII large domain-containing protein n=1 Tax=Colletotrichum destructivum TaxID=34406 RepID=A0AAX4IHL6_9PEZI|nr:hypothetical protein CDEST_07590 [Colletotrichum destructivum]